MPVLFRRPCPADANTHYCNGEQLRITRPTEGPLAGFTVIEVQAERTAELLTRGGEGWQRYVPEEVTVEDASDGGTPDGDPAGKVEEITGTEGEVVFDLSVLDGDIDALEELLTSPDMSAPWARALLAAEEGGKTRKGAIRAIVDWLEAHPEEARVILPEDPSAPLDPAVGPGEGGDALGEAVEK